MKTLEKNIERKLKNEVKNRGGFALKFVSPSFDGMPDRLILFSGGRLAFVEVKRKNEKPRPLQKRRIKMLKNLGFMVFVLDDEKNIGDIIDEIQSS